MPPEVPYCRPLLTTFVQSNPLFSTQSEEHQSSSHKSFLPTNRMQISRRRLIPLLILILSVISILRLLRLAIVTSSRSPPLTPLLPPSLNKNCDPASSTSSNKVTTLTEKELKLLKDLIARKSPCNLLIFGLQRQYLTLSSINEDGNTVFLEDNPEKINTIRTSSNNTKIYKVHFQMPARKAYDLLKNARRAPACAPTNKRLQESKCRLTLKDLPLEVYETNWDIIVIDGPSGDSPEAPGRMGSIYIASLMARKGNLTDVVVHDINRTVEKWFSWEFLCEENLLSAKGKFWHFRIRGHSNSTRFCTAEAKIKYSNRNLL